MNWNFKKHNYSLKSIVIAGIILIAIGALIEWAPWKFDIKGTITKGLIGKQDIAMWYSGDSAETFTRATSTGYTMTLNKIDWPGVDVCYVFGGGVTKTSTVIASAITAIGTTEKVEIYLSRGSWPVTGTLTIPVNITIHFAIGAYLDGTTSFAGSPDSQIKALPGQQIFSSTSTITFGVGGTGYPEWHGCDPTGVADSSVAFQKAVDAYSVIHINDGAIFYITEIDVTSKRIEGSGTIKKPYASAYALQLLGNYPIVDGVKFTPLGRPLSTVSSRDIKIGDGAVNPVVENCIFTSTDATNYSADAIGTSDDPDEVTDGGDSPYSTNIKGLIIRNNKFFGYGRPVKLFYIDGYSIIDNYFEATKRDAIRIRVDMGKGIISRNHFKDIGTIEAAPDTTRDAIDTASSADELIISENIIDTTAYVGMDIKGVAADNTTYGTKKLSIINNIIKNAYYQGLKIDSQSAISAGFIWDVSIIGNLITGCNVAAASSSVSALTFEGSIYYLNMSDNRIISNKGYGVRLTDNAIDGTDKVTNGIISKNIVINNNSYGFFIEYASDIIISENITDNNVLANTTTSGVIIDPSEVTQTYGYYFKGESPAISGISLINNINKCEYFFSVTTTNTNIFRNFSGNFDIGLQASADNTNFQKWAMNPNRQFYSSTNVPSSATLNDHIVGDVVWSTVPTIGGVIGWVCTTAGSPGTWTPFGQVGTLGSVASTPSFVGQIAVAGGHAYIAIATTGAGDWKQIDN